MWNEQPFQKLFFHVLHFFGNPCLVHVFLLHWAIFILNILFSRASPRMDSGLVRESLHFKSTSKWEENFKTYNFLKKEEDKFVDLWATGTYHIFIWLLFCHYGTIAQPRLFEIFIFVIIALNKSIDQTKENICMYRFFFFRCSDFPMVPWW